VGTVRPELFRATRTVASLVALGFAATLGCARTQTQFTPYTAEAAAEDAPKLVEEATLAYQGDIAALEAAGGTLLGTLSVNGNGFASSADVRHRALAEAARRGATHVVFGGERASTESVQVTRDSATTTVSGNTATTTFVPGARLPITRHSGLYYLVRVPTEAWCDLPNSIRPAATDDEYCSDPGRKHVAPSRKPEPPPTAPTPAPATLSLGSCFFVSPDGIAVTNHHVVEGARRIVVVDAAHVEHAATVLRSLRDVDLVALDVPSATAHAAVPIASNVALRLGQPIFTIGFPYPTSLGGDPKFANGAVGGLTGLGDKRLLQITIPIQVGNSGGPVADDDGFVVGVVVAKLNQLVMLKDTGTLPENVNFAVKSTELAGLLRGIQVPTMKRSASRADAIARVEAAACQVLAFPDDAPSEPKRQVATDAAPKHSAPPTNASPDPETKPAATPTHNPQQPAGAGPRQDNGSGSVAPPDSLDRAMISAGIEGVRDRVSRCVEDWPASGTVKVHVRVDAEGHVSEVTVSETPKEGLGRCVAGVIGKATFARTKNGGTFSYPFSF
jgi:S1-C subfamily serine protease